MAARISWDDRLAEYKHNKENGLSSSPGVNAWVSRQRKAKANNTVSEERKEKLNGVGFDWVVNSSREDLSRLHSHAWNNNFTLLEKHHSENGSCRGPYQGKLYSNWVHNQRRILNNKESLNEVQQERWARLNTLGFWNATELQREPSGNSGSGLEPTVHASQTTTSANSNSESEMGQGRQNSGVVRITVSLDSLEQSINARPKLTLISISLAHFQACERYRQRQSGMYFGGTLCCVSVFVFGSFR
jgi:Helicase associated domain